MLAALLLNLSGGIDTHDVGGWVRRKVKDLAEEHKNVREKSQRRREQIEKALDEIVGEIKPQLVKKLELPVIHVVEGQKPSVNWSEYLSHLDNIEQLISLYQQSIEQDEEEVLMLLLA